MVVVASLFSGCGGSSLGWRARGHRVGYANEVNPRAAKTYRFNMPGTTVDERDVREVRGADIVDAVGGVPDVIDGSPPCQDFSVAGRRDLDGDNAHLYYEFVRLIGEVKPRTFVAENVVGLARGQSYGMHYLPIVHALSAHGYRVKGRILDASWLGVPQARERAVLIGVREDLDQDPIAAFPRNQQRQTTIRDVLPESVRLIRPASEDVAPRHLAFRDEKSWPSTSPAPTLTTGGVSMQSAGDVMVDLRDGSRRPVTIEDARLLSGFPADFTFPPGVSATAQWKMIGNCVPPPMASAWASSVAAVLP